MAEPRCQCVVAGKVASDPDCPLAEEPVSWSGHEEIQTYLTARKGEMSDDFTCPCGHIGENCPALEDTAQRIRELEAENARLARESRELFQTNRLGWKEVDRLRAIERRLRSALERLAEPPEKGSVWLRIRLARAALAPEQDEATPAEPREPTDGDRLAEMVRAFAAAMTEKLLEKCEEGWEGWDTMGGEEAAAMAGRLIEHADRALSQPRQWVDVANFAAMLWWRRIGEHRAVMAESQEKKS